MHRNVKHEIANKYIEIIIELNKRKSLLESKILIRY